MQRKLGAKNRGNRKDRGDLTMGKNLQKQMGTPCSVLDALTPWSICPTEIVVASRAGFNDAGAFV